MELRLRLEGGMFADLVVAGWSAVGAAADDERG